MSNSPVHQYVLPGLTSSLIGGPQHGTVRLLSSERETREWVTPHSHRFDFACIVLYGMVTNTLFTRCEDQGEEWAPAEMVPTLNTKGLGDYQLRRHSETVRYRETVDEYRTGESYSMKADEIHAIRFSKGAVVLLFEGPETTRQSLILEPVSNGRRVETFQVAEWMFEHAAETPHG